jgi:hypothetical protein
MSRRRQKAAFTDRNLRFPLSRVVYRIAIIVCVLLVFVAGFVAVAHVHGNDLSSVDHSCSLCALAHTGIAVYSAAPPAPVFTHSLLSEAPAIAAPSYLIAFRYYIRPPPQA